MARYHTVSLGRSEPGLDDAAAARRTLDILRSVLRRGDRVVSVYPNGPTLHLEALLELKHPSWKADGTGWDADGGDGGDHAGE